MKKETLHMTDGKVIHLTPATDSDMAYEDGVAIYINWDIRIVAQNGSQEKLNSTTITVPFSSVLYGIKGD